MQSNLQENAFVMTFAGKFHGIFVRLNENRIENMIAWPLKGIVQTINYFTLECYILNEK